MAPVGRLERLRRSPPARGQGQLGPDAGRPQQEQERVRLALREEAIQLDGVLEDVGMDDEGDGLVERGELIVGAQRNEDIVAHSLHVDDDSSRMFRCEAAGERGNHPAAATFSMISSGMSKFEWTFWTSSWSSSVSISFNTCSAFFSSSLT